MQKRKMVLSSLLVVSFVGSTSPALGLGFDMEFNGFDISWGASDLVALWMDIGSEENSIDGGWSSFTMVGGAEDSFRASFFAFGRMRAPAGQWNQFSTSEFTTLPGEPPVFSQTFFRTLTYYDPIQGGYRGADLFYQSMRLDNIGVVIDGGKLSISWDPFAGPGSRYEWLATFWGRLSPEGVSVPTPEPAGFLGALFLFVGVGVKRR